MCKSPHACISKLQKSSVQINSGAGGMKNELKLFNFPRKWCFFTKF